MKKLTFIFIAMLFAAVGVLSASSYASPSEVATVDAVRFNKNTHRYETLCSVHYYMSGDTVFVDKQYSFLGVQFSDNATKGIVQEKAFLFSKKGNLWYTVIAKDKARHIGNSYVSAIVFRDCRWNQSQKRQCYDSYVYNISKCGVKQSNRTRFVNSVINKVN